MAKKDSSASFEISNDLKETVRKNPQIKNVYFAENGDHYFHKHEIELHSVDEKGFSTGSEKVSSLPGSKFGIVKVTDAKKVTRDKRVNISHTPIAAEFTRAEILAATAK